MHKSLKSIKLTKKEYENLKLEIQRARTNLELIRRSKKVAFGDNRSEQLSAPGIVDVISEEARALHHLKELKNMLDKAEIIVTKSEENIVDVGDVIELIIHQMGENSILVQLVGSMASQTDSDIQRVSLESPLGKAIYKKEVGEITSYVVGKNKFDVTILSKVTERELPKR